MQSSSTSSDPERRVGKRKKGADYYLRKIRKLEVKIKQLPQDEPDSDGEDEKVIKQEHQDMSGSDEIEKILEHLPQDMLNSDDDDYSIISDDSTHSSIVDNDVNINNEKGDPGNQLPEEFLLALGTEHEENDKIGKPIRPELANQWTKIMAEGLSQEAQRKLINKYPVPSNFQNAIAPEMNPEMIATLSDNVIKRDCKIAAHQNMTAKVVSCLGQALTSILNGNFNRKKLVEQINDAAKIAAYIHHNDSIHRRSLAMSCVDKITQNTIKSTEIGYYLFGSDCASKLQEARSNGAQVARYINNKPAKKQLNTHNIEQIQRKHVYQGPYRPNTQQGLPQNGEPSFKQPCQEKWNHSRGRTNWRPF